MPNQHNKLLLPTFSLPLPCCSLPFSANRHWNGSKWSTLANQPLKRVVSVTLAGHKRGVRVGESSWRHTGNRLFQQLSELKALGKPSAKSRRSEYKGVEIQVPCLSGIPAPQLGQGKSQAAASAAGWACCPASGSSHWTDPWTDVWGEQRPPSSSSRLNFRGCASKLSLIPHAGRPTTSPSPTITCNGGLSGKLHLSRAVKGVILPAQPRPLLRLPTPLPLHWSRQSRGESEQLVHPMEKQQYLCCWTGEPADLTDDQLEKQNRAQRKWQG